MPPEEVSLRDYIDMRICNVLDSLEAQKDFNALHFDLNEQAIKKAEQSMTSRLEGMNEFRDQIREERASLATKESMQNALKGVETRVELLEKSAAFSAGKLWMAMAITALVPTIIAIVAFLIR